MGLIPIPLAGGALSLGEIRGCYVPGRSLGSLFINGRGSDPPGLFFGLEVLSADGWGKIFPKWSPPEKHMLMNIPKTFSSNVLPP